MAVKTFTMLGKMYEDQDINGWYASEKLDGCRGLWMPNFPQEYGNDPDIEPTGLWSRDGKVIHAPKWWLSHLPPIPLDGELFIQRQAFQQTMSVVRKKTPVVLEWQHVKFMAFDIPMIMEEGLLRYRKEQMDIPKIQLHPDFKEQLGFRFVHHILTNKYEENEIFKVVHQEVVTKSSAQELMDGIVAQKGEGVMLRSPYSKWEQQRSNNLLKMKPFEFMDVEVVGYYYGEGKHYGRMGALEVRDVAGRVFKVGTGFTDEERSISSVGLPFHRSSYDDSVFRNGTTVKIKYRELSKGLIPKEARYERP